jgi:hypothetical protein
MSSLAGLGILSTFMYELKNYELYPVVNAQNIIIDNFPNFSKENMEEIDRLYSRSPQMYFQGIMWPSLSALAKTNALKLTCLFKPQFDYTDTRYPDPDEVHFYLKQLRELESEAGRSLGRMQDNSFNTMVAEDTAFYDGMKLRYRYETTFANEEDLYRTTLLFIFIHKSMPFAQAKAKLPHRNSLRWGSSYYFILRKSHGLYDSLLRYSGRVLFGLDIVLGIRRLIVNKYLLLLAFLLNILKAYVLKVGMCLIKLAFHISK